MSEATSGGGASQIEQLSCLSPLFPGSLRSPGLRFFSYRIVLGRGIGADQRSERGVAFAWIAGTQRSRFRGEFGHEGVGDLLVDDRFFRKYRGASPGNDRRQIRLEHARSGPSYAAWP
jgi:hypothetical protein